MAFSMVHHIRVEKNEFVATQHDKQDNKDHGEKDSKEHGEKGSKEDGEKDNKEHMFAFVEGLATPEIGQLADLIHRWQDVVEDHCMENRSCVCFTHESLLLSLLFTRLKQHTLLSSTQKNQATLTLRSLSGEKCGNNFEAIYCCYPISIRLYSLEENQKNGQGIERM